MNETIKFFKPCLSPTGREYLRVKHGSTANKIKTALEKMYPSLHFTVQSGLSFHPIGEPYGGWYRVRVGGVTLTRTQIKNSIEMGYLGD